MNDNLIQRRTYDDTFAGGDYHLDMEEKLSAVSPVPRANRTLESFPQKTVFQTERQKQLRDFFCP